jgi:hypothetical protein
MVMSLVVEIATPVRVIRPGVPIAPDANSGVVASPALNEAA